MPVHLLTELSRQGDMVDYEPFQRRVHWLRSLTSWRGEW